MPKLRKCVRTQIRGIYGMNGVGVCIVVSLHPSIHTWVCVRVCVLPASTHMYARRQMPHHFENGEDGRVYLQLKTCESLYAIRVFKPFVPDVRLIRCCARIKN